MIKASLSEKHTREVRFTKHYTRFIIRPGFATVTLKVRECLSASHKLNIRVH